MWYVIDIFVGCVGLIIGAPIGGFVAVVATYYSCVISDWFNNRHGADANVTASFAICLLTIPIGMLLGAWFGAQVAWHLHRH